jgi:Glutaminase
MEQPLTPEQAQEVFDALAARGDELCFRWLAEGCESRAQLMIEQLLAMGLTPGRAWAMAVGRLLRFPQPDDPRRSYKWQNHVAPTVSVSGAEHGVLVLDPSLSPGGPVTLRAWAVLLRVRSVEISTVGLSQAEILSRQAARALRGEELDAILFNLGLGEAPIPERGGTGFCIGPDPPRGVSIWARLKLEEIRKLMEQRRGQP